MEHTLRCNVLKCRKELSDNAVVTTCSHTFCIECANTCQLSAQHEGRRLVCPACDMNLPNTYDVVVTNLKPTEDYKTSILSGLSPSVIMECASRAMNFWTYQTGQEIVYQEHMAKNLTDKYATLNTQMNKFIHNANGEIKNIRSKMSGEWFTIAKAYTDYIPDMHGDHENLRRKHEEVIQALKERTRKHLQTQELYDKLKGRTMVGQVQNAASDAVDHTIQASAAGERLVDKNSSYFSNFQKPDMPPPITAPVGSMGPPISRPGNPIGRLGNDDGRWLGINGEEYTSQKRNLPLQSPRLSLPMLSPQRPYLSEIPAANKIARTPRLRPRPLHSVNGNNAGYVGYGMSAGIKTKKSYLKGLKAELQMRERPGNKQKIAIPQPSNPIHPSHALDRATTFTNPLQTVERQAGIGQDSKRPREAAWPLRQHAIVPSSQAPSSPIPVYCLEVTQAPDTAIHSPKPRHLTVESAWKKEFEKAQKKASQLQQLVDELDADLAKAKSEQYVGTKLKRLELLHVIEKLTAKCGELENSLARQQAEVVRCKADAERYQRMYEAENAKLTELQAPCKPESEYGLPLLPELADEMAIKLLSQQRNFPTTSSNIFSAVPEEYWAIDGREEFSDPYDSSGFLIDEAFSESVLLPDSTDEDETAWPRIDSGADAAETKAVKAEASRSHLKGLRPPSPSFFYTQLPEAQRDSWLCHPAAPHASRVRSSPHSYFVWAGDYLLSGIPLARSRSWLQPVYCVVKLQPYFPVLPADVRMVRISTLFTACVTVYTAIAEPIFNRDVAASNISSLGRQLSSGAAIYTPSSPQWANQTSRYSSYQQPTFNYVVVPAVEQDIILTMKYAESHNIQFMAQGGGHGFSSTLQTIQNAIMINMENFRYAIVDNSSNTVRVGGATVSAEVISALYDAGREMTIGLAPCVGMIGVTLGGGHGRLQGAYGLIIDNLVSLRVITANGTPLTVSATQNPDLFYGMKGAGQNFGVVTEAVYNTHPQISQGLYYNVDMLFTGDKLEAILTLINSFIPNQPAELAFVIVFLGIDPTGPPNILVNIVWSGPRSTGLKYSQPFNATNPLSFTESILTWPELPTKSGEGAFGSTGCVNGLKQDVFTANIESYNLTTFRSVFDQFGVFQKSSPDLNETGILMEVFPRQAVNAAQANLAAYANRGKENVLFLLSNTFSDIAHAPAADAFGKSIRDQVAATSGYGQLYAYQNYAHGDESLNAFYGDAARLSVLSALKKKYDPGNVFSGYHDIPLPGRRALD
ncbi:hypothetical protein B7494_g6222 [Chlorociboria aeruginascens]|nr:hypothetical protein B7494_g6222 [Chlorociboria aeruginascens]